MTKKITLFLAAVSIILAIGYYFFLSKNKETPSTGKDGHVKIVPGSNKAMLTLADGSKIELDSSNNGILSQPVANTVSTPRGGQHKLILPDGTLIYMNAATSIKFPIDFAAKERKVELTGEAYFEVTKNVGMPFKVVTKGVEILALGTQFNVKSYGGEAIIQATLLEGSLQVQKAAVTRILKPGQQALITDKIKVVKVYIDQEVAWKEGYFSFEDKDLKTILQEISNWYNVDIVYQGDITQIQLNFGGKLHRNMSIRSLLKHLNTNGLNLELQEETRKIIVRP